MLYNYIKQKIKTIYVNKYSEFPNSIIIFQRKNNKGKETKIFLSCKKNNKNLIYLIIPNIEEENKHRDMNTKSFDTNDFEINSFCHFQINSDNHDDNTAKCSKGDKNYENEINANIIFIYDNQENNDANNIDYFLAGGYDIKTNKSMIKLYKIISENNSFEVRLKDILNINLENIDDFVGPIINIVQANDNNILATTSNGNIHSFSSKYIFEKKWIFQFNYLNFWI